MLKTNRKDPYKWIAPIYDPCVGLFLKPVRNGIRRICLSFECERVLDVGCGTGEQVRVLAQAGLNTAGMDVSPAMLSKAISATTSKAPYLVADARYIPFATASFDCVSLSLALHEMEYSSALKVVREALRVLKKRGKLIIFDYEPGNGFLSSLIFFFLHLVERMAGKEHFKNFKYFIERGGVRGFVEHFSVTILLEDRYLARTMAILVSESG